MVPLSRPMTAGADPPSVLLADCCAVQARGLQVARRGQSRVRLPWCAALERTYSGRGCGMPASRARTSVSRYRRCPPRVRMEVSFPAFAHRVTVLGSTRNIVATSAGVSSGSASGVRADMWPLLLDQYCDPASYLPWLRVEPAVDVPI